MHCNFIISTILIYNPLLYAYFSYSFTVKSRVLLSLEEEESEVYGPTTPFCLHDMLTRWLSVASSKFGTVSNPAADTSDALLLEPVLPKIDTLDVESDGNQTGGEEGQGGHRFKVKVKVAPQVNAIESEQAMMHPDIAVMTPPANRKQVNATA